MGKILSGMTKLPIIESYWVEESQFLAGEYPGSYDAISTRRRMDAFLEAGVNTFIDLTLPHELTSYEDILKEQAKIYGVNTSYHRFPIVNRSVPNSDAMTAILNTIDGAIAKSDCVYVHCWGGVGRTGLVIGCYLVRHDLTNEQALARVNQLYKTRPHNPYLPNSPETDEQIEFIRNWWDEQKYNQKICEG
jgi:protein-tyrosine phosphatase